MFHTGSFVWLSAHVCVRGCRILMPCRSVNSSGGAMAAGGSSVLQRGYRLLCTCRGGERGCVNIHTHTHTVRGSPAEWHERAISRASVCVYQLSLSVLPAPMHLQPGFFSLIHTSLLFLSFSLSHTLIHQLTFSHYYNKR